MFGLKCEQLKAMWLGCDWHSTGLSAYIWILNALWQPLQYFCLENPIDRGPTQAAIHGLTKSQTRLKWLSVPEVNLSKSTVCRPESHRLASGMGSLVKWDWEIHHPLARFLCLLSDVHILNPKTCSSEEFCLDSLIPGHFSPSWLRMIFFQNKMLMNRQEIHDLKKRILGNASLTRSAEDLSKGCVFYTFGGHFGQYFHSLHKPKKWYVCVCTQVCASTQVHLNR